MTASAQALFDAIVHDPGDVATREVYADYLEQAGDPRCAFIRKHLELSPLSPDHPQRIVKETELSVLRKGLANDAWLRVIEPERAYLSGDGAPRACGCFSGESLDGERRWQPPQLHCEPQDTECDAWKRVCDLVEDVATKRGTTLAIDQAIKSADEWPQIVTLPPTIAKLTEVTTLQLYGSYLARIPPEIGQMTSLAIFTPYTSYRLHWFPYEITRCKYLANSTISTRALYGNHKYRPPFPALAPSTLPAVARACSVCERTFDDRGEHRVWISLRVATDVIPLLVNACSSDCVRALPTPPDGYVPTPHRGGLDLEQPRRR